MPKAKKKVTTTTTTVTTVTTESVASSMLLGLVVDQSYSMFPQREDTIQGVNRLLDDNRDLGADTYVTLTLFSNRPNVLFDGADIRRVEGLSERTYQPGGSTALLWAIAETVERMEGWLARRKDKPDQVLLAIQTDGMENVSPAEYTKAAVGAMLEAKKKAGWTVIFLGEGFDAFTEGQSLGIANANSRMYRREETAQTYNLVSSGLKAMRTNTKCAARAGEAFYAMAEEAQEMPSAISHAVDLGTENSQKAGK